MNKGKLAKPSESAHKASVPGQKAAGTHSKIPGPAQGSLLYSFRNGVLRTLEVPSFKLETHSQRFPHYRCGFANGKFYFLQRARTNYFSYDNESLGDRGKLLIYDPHNQRVEKTVDTCCCNESEFPLFIRGNELLDFGWYSKVITIGNGQRKLIATLGDIPKTIGAACRVGSKTIYLINGGIEKDEDNEYSEEMEGGIYAMNCSNFKYTQVAAELSKQLEHTSMIPLSNSDFLILCTLHGTPGTAVYTFSSSTNAVQQLPTLQRNLPVCQSSCILDSRLYMLFIDSMLGICNLSTGIVHFYHLGKYAKLRTFLWAMQHTRFRRLPIVLVRETLASLIELD